MTIVTGGTMQNSTDFDSDALTALDTSTLVSPTATQFALSSSSFNLTALGTGLTYSSGHPSGGTITSISYNEGGGTTTMSGFSISASTLWHAISTGDVTGFNNLFFSGDDTFNMQAGSGPDFLSGGAGNDTFNFGAAFSDASHIDGGTGNDNAGAGRRLRIPTLGYVTNVETVKLGDGHSYNLGTSPVTTSAIDASALTGYGHTLTIHDQPVNSGTLNITGGAGDDTFVVGLGGGSFDGGAGTDTIDYSNAGAGATVNLNLATAQAAGVNVGAIAISHVENIVGTDFSDTLTGNASDNVFEGGRGNDVIDGGGGNDTVSFQNIPLDSGATGVTIDLRPGTRQPATR